jgi:hypothetical protein
MLDTFLTVLPMAKTFSIRAVRTHPNKVIIYSMIASGVVIVLDDLVANHTVPAPHEFIAPIAIGIVLGFLADVAPEATKLFAVLIFLGILFIRGPDFLPFLKIGEEMPVGPTSGKADTLASNGNGGKKKKKHGGTSTPPTSGGHGFLPK